MELFAPGNSQSTLQRIPLSSPASGPMEPRTQSFVGNVSLSKQEKKNKSFENSALSKETSEGETGQRSKVTKTDESGNTSVVEGNETQSLETENQTTPHSTPTRQPYPMNGSGEVRAKVKVKVRSDSKQTTESSATCCGALTSDPQTTEAAAAMDVYNNYNEYDDDDNNNDADSEDDDNNDRGDDNYERNLYGYNDSSDGKQALGDYREEDTEEDSAEASKPEYVYATDNVTSNETEISSNQDQSDLNSDPSYYYSQEAAAASAGDAADWRASGPSADRVDDGGHSFGGSPPQYEAGSRDYHFGTKHRSFDMYLGQKISEMRSGSYHGRPSLSLRWLEHRQVNHFAIFLWLVAALVIVGLAITAYRFRHSVYNAIQSTRTNYKQGRRIGIEEANDLLSHAQV